MKAEQKPTEKSGHFIAPVNRLFGYFLTQLQMKNLLSLEVLAKLDGNLLNANMFQNCLKTVVKHPVKMWTVFEEILESLGLNQGFIAEVRAKKWIYKGLTFNNALPDIYQKAFKPLFLNDLALV